MYAAAPAKSLQSCLTLCNPIDSPPGSRIPGILQARTLEWVAISFSSAWKWKVKVKSLSCVQLLATPWVGAYQAPPSMGFSWQKYGSGVPLPSLNVCIGDRKKRSMYLHIQGHILFGSILCANLNCKYLKMFQILRMKPRYYVSLWNLKNYCKELEFHVRQF